MLKGKVAVVTGGASGIGRAIALAMAQHGARAVIIGDLRPDPIEGGLPTAQLVAELGGHSVFVPTDISSATACSELIAAADAFGGIDIMVCNAGVAAPDDGPDVSQDAFQRMVSINLNGTMISAQAAAMRMREHGKAGSIVIISSMGGLRGSAMTVGYSATKGAACLLAASLADALGPEGIRVNAVCPGLINTSLVQNTPVVAAAVGQMSQRTPLRRLGEPREVGDAVAWLASDYASFVTGVSLPVDGGHIAIV